MTKPQGWINGGYLSIGTYLDNAWAISIEGFPANVTPPTTDAFGNVTLWLIPNDQNNPYSFTASPPHGSNYSAFTLHNISVTSDQTELSPAKIWIGVKNNDDNGIKFDIQAEVYKDTQLISTGEIDSVAGGSSGFAHAKLQTIPFNTFSPIDFPINEQLHLKLAIRNACSGSGKNSGIARLWYNDGQANSQIGVTIGTNTNTYYLLDNYLLGTTEGITKKPIDVQAGAKCSPFKPFGTWSVML